MYADTESVSAAVESNLLVCHCRTTDYGRQGLDVVRCRCLIMIVQESFL